MADLGIFIRIQAVGAEGVNADFSRAAAAADNLEKRSNAASGKVDELGRSLERTGRHAWKASDSMNLVTKAAVSLVSIQAVRKIFDIGDNYRAMSERVRMATNSIGEFQYAQDRLLKSANTSFRPLAEAQEMFIATSGNLRAMGYSLGQSLDITDSLSFAFVRNATSAQRAESAIINYDKALSRGVMNGEQWRVFSGAVETVAKNIGDAFGKTAQEIDKMGHDGLLTVQMINEGLRRSLNENKAAADSMANTVGDSFVKLGNEFSYLWGGINESLGVTSLFASGIIGVADNLEYALVPALALGAIGAGKLTSSALLTANAFRGSALEAARYQVALAKMTGASSVAARSMVATSVVARSLSSTMAFLGGPIGVITTVATAAAGGLMLFSNSSQDAKTQASILRTEIQELTDSLEGMARAKVEASQIRYTDKFLDLTSQRKSLESDISAIEGVLEHLQRQYDYYANRGAEDKSTSIQIEEHRRRLVFLREEYDSVIESLGMVDDALASINERAKTTSDGLLAIGAWRKLAGIDDFITGTKESINLTGESLGIYTSMAKRMHEINNKGVEAQLIFDRAFGNLKGMNETTYQFFLNWARATDQQAIFNANSQELSGILNSVEEQYKNIGLTTAQITRNKAIALGISKEDLAILDMQLAAIGNAPKVGGGGGRTSLNYFDDALKSINEELITTKSLTQDLLMFGDPSQYNSVREMTMQLNDQSGVLAKILPAQRELLLMKAQELDSQKQINAILGLRSEYGQDLDDLYFELDLLGKGQTEIEKLTFYRDLDKQSRLLSIGMTESNIAILDKEIAKIKEGYGAYEAAKKAREESMGIGVELGFQQYIDNIGNMRDQFASATESVLGHMEGFLVDFAMTGKLNFRDMTTSILQDISKMMIRMAMLNAVTGMQGWFSGLGFSSGGYVPGYATGGRVIDFSGGGFTGMGGMFEPKGIVHGGEYVMSKAAVNNLGVGYFEQLHDLAKSGRGFASGGSVGGSSIPPAYMVPNNSRPAQQPAVKEAPIDIHIVVNTEDGTVETNAGELSAELGRRVDVRVDKRVAHHSRKGGMLGR